MCLRGWVSHATRPERGTSSEDSRRRLRRGKPDAARGTRCGGFFAGNACRAEETAERPSVVFLPEELLLLRMCDMAEEEFAEYLLWAEKASAEAPVTVRRAPSASPLTHASETVRPADALPA